MGWGVRRLLVRTDSVDAATGVVSEDKMLSASPDMKDQKKQLKVIRTHRRKSQFKSIIRMPVFLSQGPSNLNEK